MTEKQSNVHANSQERIQLLETCHQNLDDLRAKAQKISWSLPKSEDENLLALLNRIEDESNAVADLLATRIIKLGFTDGIHSPKEARHNEDEMPPRTEAEILTSLEAGISALQNQTTRAAEVLRTLGDERSAEIMDDLYSASGKWRWRIEHLRD